MSDVEQMLRRAAGPARHGVATDQVRKRASVLRRRRAARKVLVGTGVAAVLVVLGLGLATLVSDSGEVVATTAELPALDPQAVSIAGESSVESTLFDAIRTGDADLVRDIVETDMVDLEARTSNGLLTPLMVAAFRGDTEVVEYLIEQGADLQARSQSGSTALEVAARAGAGETWLALATAEPVPQEMLDRSLLAAALSGDADMVSAVIEAGAQLQPAGSDALLLAIEEVPSLGVVEVLVGAGVDPSVAASGGQVPRDVARELGRAEILEFLEKIS